MGFKKWLMKQQWRIIQVRGIWGLFYGILLLAAAYYGYLPYIKDMGELGPFVFAGILVVSFAILGYLYDRVFVLWAPSHEVTQERNPYQYVGRPIDHIFWLPLYSVILKSCEELAAYYDLDDSIIQETKEYYSRYEQLRPEIKEDIETAIKLREEFIQKHSFADILEETQDE
ncbi:MAG: hypothetical protein ACFFDQ_10730 [Candidatus Thorarchaeota archaeon]